jgi:hypothetical protein
MLLNAGLPVENTGFYGDGEMRATALTPAGMTGMLMADILNIKKAWLEPGF